MATCRVTISSVIPCQVRKLPVPRVILVRNPANNGELLAGALPQGECFEGRTISWEVVSLGLIDPVTTELERARLIRQARMGNTPALVIAKVILRGEDIVYALAKARDKT